MNGRDRTFLEAGPDLMVLMDRAGRFLDFNVADESKLYVSPGSIIGKNLEQIVPEQLARKATDDIRRALDSGRVQTREYRLSIGGQSRQFEACFIANGENKVLVMVSDRTEQKRTEEKLSKTNAQLSALVEHLQDGILLENDSGRIMVVNHQFCAMFGTSIAPETLRGMAFSCFTEMVKTLFVDAEGFVDRTFEILRGRRAVRGEELRLVDGRILGRDYAPIFDGEEFLGHLWHYRDVTERKRAEGRKTEQMRQAAFRADVSTALTASGDLRSILQRCAEATVQRLGAAFARIWTLNEERTVLELRASAGMYTHLDSPHGRVPIGKFKIGRIAQERRPHLTNEVLEDPRVGDKEWAQREGLVGFAGHPLIVEGRLVGVMAMFAREPLAEDVLEALASVADAIAQGIQRKQAEEALKESEERHRRQARELALLHEVRTALAQELDLPVVFRAVVEAIARTYGYTLVSAYLLQGEQLILQHQVGYEHVIERIPLTEGVSGEVVRTGRAVLLEDVRTKPEFLGAIQGIVSEVCVPLFDEGRVVGVLNIESTGGVKLTEGDLRLMNALGEHVGIAIGRARLYTRVRESEERFRALVQNSSDLITLYDADGTIRYVSPALERMLGYEPEERIGKTSFGLLHPDDVVWAKQLLAEALQDPGIPMSAEVRARHRDGSWRYIEAVSTNLLDHPSVGAVVLNGRDITDRKETEARLREAEEKYRTLIERIPTITYIQEPEEPSRTTYISPQYEEILGYSVEECLGDPEHWTSILHPDDRERVLAEDGRTNATGDPFRMEYRQFAKDGSVVWIRDEATAVRDEEGRLRYWIGVQTDITERKMLEERLAYQAFHDSLTGLPNRALFMDRLEHALSRARREKGEVAVLFLDIDNLKVVNDTLGHEAGDGLLVAATKRLRMCLRPADTVARLSGDEFAILLEDVGGVSRAIQVAERVAETLRKPLTLKQRETFITASIGIALSKSVPGSDSSSARDQAETLLRQADLAMYRAKSKGKAHYEIFVPSMNASAFERLKMGNDLRRALERDEFRVYYQPKMRLPADPQQSLRFSGSPATVAPEGAIEEPRIIGMEALVRWEHPERGLLSPEEFVPVAEESGLIVPIGRKVLEEACRQARSWEEHYAGEAPLDMCVNISARQFQHPELVRDVARILQQTRLDPRCLQVEITESVVMQDAHSTLNTLNRLEDLGIALAIDDFGTGYSSLSYLKRLPVKLLKIDRSFIKRLGEDTEDAVIVSGIVSLAHALGMQVVAEGVETAEQLMCLRELGCDMAQGNYFSEPLPGEAASALLARHLSTRPRADS